MNNVSDSNDVYRVIKPFLLEDEQLLWTGRPHTTYKYHPPVYASLVMIFCLSFAVFWTVMATVTAGFFGLFGIPFLAAGIYVNLTLHVLNRKKLSQTVYAVTDRRAIIIKQKAKGVECHEFVLSNLSGINLEFVKGNSGTITFAVNSADYWYINRNSMPGLGDKQKTAFLMIDDVYRVYNLIMNHRTF